MPPLAKPAALRQRQNRSMTHATIEAPPAARIDLPGLVALATLWDEFWQAADTAQRAKAHAEARMASMQFGLTPMSRRSLQWEVKRVERASAVPSATPAPTRRRDPRLRALA